MMMQLLSVLAVLFKGGTLSQW